MIHMSSTNPSHSEKKQRKYRESCYGATIPFFPADHLRFSGRFFFFNFIYLFISTITAIKIIFQQLIYRRMSKVWFTEVNNNTTSSSEDPTTTTSRYVRERLLQLLILHKISLSTSCQKEFGKEQLNKIRDVVSVSWWQKTQLELAMYPVLHRRSLVNRAGLFKRRLR